MNLEAFNKMKEDLIISTHKELENSPSGQESYKAVLKILSGITYQNRKDEKGGLAHFVVDSYDGDANLGSMLIDFDNRL